MLRASWLARVPSSQTFVPWALRSSTGPSGVNGSAVLVQASRDTGERANRKPAQRFDVHRALTA